MGDPEFSGRGLITFLCGFKLKSIKILRGYIISVILSVLQTIKT